MKLSLSSLEVSENRAWGQHLNKSKDVTWRKTGSSRFALLATNEGDERRWHGQGRNPSYPENVVSNFYFKNLTFDSIQTENDSKRINLPQKRVQRQAFVNTVMTIVFHKKQTVVFLDHQSHCYQNKKKKSTLNYVYSYMINRPFLLTRLSL
jgi:hypothetical protein